MISVQAYCHKFQKSCFLAFLLLSPALGWTQEAAFDSIQTHHVKAYVHADGLLFHSPRGEGGLQMNQGNDFGILSAMLWMGGYSSDGNLYLSAGLPNDSTERKALLDFQPGALQDNGAPPPPPDEAFWNQVWKISRHQVNHHRQNFQNDGYQVPAAIQNWPVHAPEQLSGNYDEFIAPYFDVAASTNFVYEPEKGDFPHFKGDQALFFVVNDLMPNPAAGGRPMNLQLKGMLYAYQNEQDFLQNTLFLDLTIENKGEINLEDFYVGLFQDFGFKKAASHLMASHPELNMLVAYPNEETGHTYENEVPAQGILLLAEEMHANTHFPAAKIPDEDLTFYHYLSGKDQNGTNIGTGDFPSLLNPALNCEAMHAQATDLAADFQAPHYGVLAHKRENFNLTQQLKLTFAFVYASGQNTKEALCQLEDYARQIQNFDASALSAEAASNKLNGLQLFPNPVKNGNFQIAFDEVPKGAVQTTLINLNGQTVAEEIHPAAAQIHLSFPGNAPKGMYLLRVTDTQSGQYSTKKVIHH